MTNYTFQIRQDYDEVQIKAIQKLLLDPELIEDFLMKQNEDTLKKKYQKSLDSGDSALVI